MSQLIHMEGITRSVVLPDGSTLDILRGVNIDISAGQTVAIVGRSGTGKSTLLNIMGLLDKANSGTYEFCGHDTTQLSDSAAAKLRGSSIGFIFQQFNIFSERTVIENVAVPLMYGSGREFFARYERARQVLAMVGLSGREESYPAEMSGGEQQRIAIARSLVREPQLIVADEPTGALDVDTGRTVMGVLEDVVAQSGAALVTITHDLAIAERSQRQYSLFDGVLHEGIVGLQ